MLLPLATGPRFTVPLSAPITVRIPGPLRDCCGGATELSLAAPSVRAALDALERSHPALHRSVCDETGAVRRHINVFVNTSHVRDCGGLDAPLAPGDVVTILPAVSGG
jgi:molybdopterin converting factor small subunit